VIGQIQVSSWDYEVTPQGWPEQCHRKRLAPNDLEAAMPSLDYKTVCEKETNFFIFYEPKLEMGRAN
jgi:hypothetical protein